MCKGNIGILKANEKKQNNHKINCLSYSILVFDKRLKLVVPVSKYIISKEKNRKIDPNNVYKKNNMVAFIRLCLDPQIPIIKNIGIKILSKKIKKVIISNDAKERIKNNSSRTK